jgi:hypothetical protein
VTIPANYDDVTMNVNPALMLMAAGSIQMQAQAIASSVGRIGDAIGQLQLSWTGLSAAEASDFAGQWTNTMTGLFGSDSSPQSGAVNQVLIALEAASGNYSACEEALTQMFNKFADTLSSDTSDGNSPEPAGTNLPDGNLSAVGEINWTALP